jgi:hypothetical protein
MVNRLVRNIPKLNSIRNERRFKYCFNYSLSQLYFQDLLFYRGFFWEGQDKKGKGKGRKKKGKK